MNTPESINHPLLLFDGVCNLCNGTVNWIIKHDPEGIIHFASLQSDLAERKLKGEGLDNQSLSSVILIKGNQFYTQSEAILQVLGDIKPGGFLFTLLSLIPKPLRDWGYKQVARNRYRIFGKKNTCMVPKPEWRERFPA